MLANISGAATRFRKTGPAPHPEGLPMATLRERFQALFEVESIARYQGIVYTSLWLWGVYAFIYSEPPSSITTTMGSGIYTVWLWVHLTAPAVVLGGHLAADKLAGLWMQWAGNSALALAVGTFIASEAITKTQVHYWTFPLTGLALACAGLAVRDIIRIAHAEGWCGRHGGC